MPSYPKKIIALGDGLRLSLEVESVSRQGLRIRGLDLRRTRIGTAGSSSPSRVPGQMRALSRLHLKGEKLEVVDYDPIRELGLLRSAPPREEAWQEYFELSLDQGFRILLHRFAFDRAHSRKQEIAFGLGREDLLELVDELGKVLKEAPDREELDPAVRHAA